MRKSAHQTKIFISPIRLRKTVNVLMAGKGGGEVVGMMIRKGSEHQSEKKLTIKRLIMVQRMTKPIFLQYVYSGGSQEK